MSVGLFKSLLFKSTRIQQEIDREQRRSLPDRWRLIKLKKIRLAIKDRIERIIQPDDMIQNARLQPLVVTVSDRRRAKRY